MENTNDVIFSTYYLTRARGRRYKKRSIKERVLTILSENKAIAIIISTMTALMIADFFLINAFMNLMVGWGRF